MSKSIAFTTVEAIKVEGSKGPMTLTLESQWKCYKAFRDAKGRELILYAPQTFGEALSTIFGGDGMAVAGSPDLMAELGLLA